MDKELDFFQHENLLLADEDNVSQRFCQDLSLLLRVLLLRRGELLHQGQLTGQVVVVAFLHQLQA